MRCGAKDLRWIGTGYRLVRVTDGQPTETFIHPACADALWGQDAASHTSPYEWDRKAP